ncbi:MAG TPA: hypothetical protein VMU87_21680 [Stellaceae bacterium]|nr:hypothetical protein [Stellaceae bacterium]
MSRHGTNGADRRRRPLVSGLWIAAAATVVAGFVVRALSSFLGRADLRVAGIALIAIGIAAAVLGWLGERIVARRSP